MRALQFHVRREHGLSIRPAFRPYAERRAHSRIDPVAGGNQSRLQAPAICKGDLRPRGPRRHARKPGTFQPGQAGCGARLLVQCGLQRRRRHHLAQRFAVLSRFKVCRMKGRLRRTKPVGAAILGFEAVQRRGDACQLRPDSRGRQQSPAAAHDREGSRIGACAALRGPRIDQRHGKSGARREDGQRGPRRPGADHGEVSGFRHAESGFSHVNEVAMLHCGVQRWHRFGRLAASVPKV